MMVVLKTLWSLATSRIGLSLIGAAVFLALLWGWGFARYEAGKVDGAAEVQARIDAPVTGWAARLDLCEGNVRTARQAIEGQNTAIARNAAESAKALANAQAAVDVAQARTAQDARTLAALRRPLTAPDSCARMQEMDRRLLESLNAR